MGGAKTLSIIVAANIKGLETSMKQANKSIGSFASNAARLGSMLTFGVTAPLVAMGRTALNTFAEFEDGMMKVKAVTGATDREFKMLTDNAKKLGATTRFTSQQFADLQLVLGRKGFDPSAIKNMTSSIAKLALATGSDLGLAAEVVASSINAFNLESTEAWSTTLQTDLQTNGTIDAQWYEKKESDWFAFVRADNNPANPAPDSEYFLRSVSGIAQCSAVSGSAGPSAIVTFPLTISIGSIVSVGDFFYFGVSPTYAPQWGGTIREINVDLVGGINNIKVDNSVAGGVIALPAAPFYCMFVKNSIAESHGMLGHYCEFTLTNDSETAVELFAVESEIMKSFP